MSARITVRSKSRPSVAVHLSLSYDNHNGSNPDGLRPRPATATATGCLCYRVAQSNQMGSNPSSILLLSLCDHRPNSSPAPEPHDPRVPTIRSDFFSHAYSLPGPLRGANFFHSNAILAFPHRGSYSAPRLRRKKSACSRHRRVFFFSPLNLCYSARLSLSTAPQLIYSSHTKVPVQNLPFFTRAQC